MTKYPSISTIFKRDERKRIIEGMYAEPEFTYLANNPWVFNEKVDGTNIRLHYDGSKRFRDNEYLYVAGRTDDAVIPPHLLPVLLDIMRAAPFEKAFSMIPDNGITLYGEGYGAKIGKNGYRYNPVGCGFILFDVKVGDWWLRRRDVEDVADKLGLDVVPIIGTGTLADAVEMARVGFPSQRFPGVTIAEGLIARPMVQLFDREGRRVITKIKYKDFR